MTFTTNAYTVLVDGKYLTGFLEDRDRGFLVFGEGETLKLALASFAENRVKDAPIVLKKFKHKE